MHWHPDILQMLVSLWQIAWELFYLKTAELRFYIKIQD